MNKSRIRWIIKWSLISLFGLSLMSGLTLHFVAGPRGVQDGWRPAVAAPSHLSDNELDLGFEVGPDIALVDEPISIRGTLLKPNEEVIVRASTVDANDRRFTSWGRFRADKNGQLDLSSAPPVEGTYLEATAHGLLWSMRSKEDRRFSTSKDWSELEIELQMETSRGVQSHKLTRRYPWKPLNREIITGDGVEGQLWIPNRTEPVPAIIKLGGWGDGAAPLSSSLMASRGFAVLDLGYHAREHLPEELVSIPIETVSRAIDLLAKNKKVDVTRIGIYGVSKGAELALLAASREPRIDSVVVWAPSSVVFSGISFKKVDPGSSWSDQGIDVPYAKAPISYENFRNAARLILRRPVSFRNTYLSALANANEASRIPVEKISGPVLFVAGSDDQMWPSEKMVSELTARLEQHSFSHRAESIIIDGAGHALDFSLWPGGGGPSRMFVRGGDPDASHRGGHRAWMKTLEWFQETLKVKPTH